jgi:hypothetical protein
VRGQNRILRSNSPAGLVRVRLIALFSFQRAEALWQVNGARQRVLSSQEVIRPGARRGTER